MGRVAADFDILKKITVFHKVPMLWVGELLDRLQASAAYPSSGSVDALLPIRMLPNDRNETTLPMPFAR